ncbi:RagB/SusD family nutrient uptake outer membrane protein [Mucilaginibacter sp. dw_454]|uniref:RagB/SusD family nutrient uptake outer membrane protein n=1 Tax=Mucilaginibacter sp. dw_454 TaxID=2720079 RepID=UPI001BD6B33E|nr:RagB/SusD family nutrient uptake outer membrane protein [Mucilaginibacter sp. dw_454]
MKAKHNYIFLAVALLFTATGCKKILDQPVVGVYSSSNYFTNDANTILAVNSAYSPLTFTDASSNAIWVLGDVASDDAIKGGSAGDQGDFQLINDFNINPSNSAVEAVWKRYYQGVFACNVVTNGLAGTTTGISPTVKTQALAQAKFLRAYYYFVLTTCYGNIPLHLEVPQTPTEAQKPISAQALIYAQIEKDCTDAAADLPPSWTGADLGRVTKGAALALLAKTYLFEQKWALAASTAQAVDALNIYSLLPVFADNFRAATKNNAEAIFTVEHQTGLVPFQGNNLNVWFQPTPLGGYGFFYPTQSLVSNFEKSPGGVDDPRLDYTVARAGHPYFDSAFDPAWTSTGYLSKKDVQPQSEIPRATIGDGNLNYPAIRYADVLLIEAEALNESGNSGGALAPLNRVRKRARESYLYDNTLSGFGTVPSGLLPDIITTDQSQLRDIIRRERRSELALEFHRFFDIIRYGSAYANSALADEPLFNYNTNKFFPIPQSERDTNPNLGL